MKTWWFFGPIVASSSLSGAASAFDYPEHQYFASLSLDLFLKLQCEDDENGTVAVCAPSREALLDATFALISTGNECKLDDFIATAPSHNDKQVAQCPGLEAEGAKTADNRYSLWGKRRACFNLADLPALSGDHASSPVNLLWRWFNPALVDRCQTPRIWQALTTAWHDASLNEPPENAREAKPDIAEFLKLMFEHQVDRWPKLPAGLSELAGLDDAVFALKDRSAHHYRAAFQLPERAAVAERYSYDYEGRADRHKPARHALAWYADMHAGALHFAGLAGGEPDAQTKELLLGVAGLLELSAQHYLQDAVAPGHMVVDALRYTAFSAGDGHDKANQKGLLVAPRREFCGTPFPAMMPALCEAEGRQVPLVRLYGDLEIATCRGKTAWQPTRDWVAAVGAISLEEVAKASRVRFPRSFDGNVDASCATAPICDDLWQHYSGSIDPQQEPALRCLFDWWETMTSRALRSAAIEAGFARMTVLSYPLVPLQRGTAQTMDELITELGRGTFEGRGMEFGSTARWDDRYERPSFGFRYSLTSVQSYLWWFPNELQFGAQVLFGATNQDGRVSGILSLPWRLLKDPIGITVGGELSIGADFTCALVGTSGFTLGIVPVNLTDVRATLTALAERVMRGGSQHDSWSYGGTFELDFRW